KAGNGVRLYATTLLDKAEEPAEALVDHRLGHLLPVGVEGLERRRHGLEVADLDLVELDPELVERLADLGPLNENADRAGNGVGAGDDVVGGEPNDVAGRSGDGAELGHHGLLLGDLAQRRKQRLAAGR